VIRHAYGGPCDRRIELQLTQHGSELRFDLRDHAPAVDPETVRPRDLEDCRPGGLGINFIDSLMDSWSMHPMQDGSGNLLTMYKRISDDGHGDEHAGDDAAAPEQVGQTREGASG
jgi:sigma-B regulation protein RsbU (phosphoserine phosphatase)